MDTSILQPGDFILFSGKSFISRGIKFFSKSKWTHVAFFVGNGYIIEATAAGVEKNLLAPLIKKTEAIAVMRVPNLTVEQMELMKAKAYAMLGEKYDVWQLLTFSVYFTLRKIGIIWPLLIGDRAGEVVCSTFGAMLLMVIPLKLCKRIKQATPDTFYSSGSLNKVYEEEIK